jgi:SAM-dependent methyltransferase
MKSADSEAAELDRIVSEYRRREATLPPSRDSLIEPGPLFLYQQRCRAMLNMLSEHGVLPLRDKTILDVGCGGGQGLVDFESWGARRQNLAGIDLLEESARLARGRLVTGERAADIRTGNAAELPWSDETFDIVNQSTMFTSILSDALRKAIADEMVRVTRRGGVILWYDFRVNNPVNPHVRRVGAGEIRSLFAGCEVNLRLITLAPPVARRLVPLSWVGALMLENLRIFNTHYFGVIRPLPRDRRSQTTKSSS